MRFILALIPPKQTISVYLHAAQMLFSPVHDGYLLSDNSLPHITVCQFECDNENDVQVIWKQIEKLNIRPFSPRFTGLSFIKPFSPRFTGLSFIKGVGVHEEYYWAELSVARDQEMMKVHQLAAGIIRSKGLACLNDSDNLYRPHLTLARIRLPDTIQRWPDALLTNTSDFKFALARGDNNGQYLYTLFESPEVLNEIGQSKFQQADDELKSDFAVIYRGYLKPGREGDYQNAWQAVAQYFIKHRGATGSCLHQTLDGMWVAYSRWPDQKTRDASWPGENAPSNELPQEIREAVAIIQDCLDLDRKLPDICMEVVNDLLLREPDSAKYDF